MTVFVKQVMKRPTLVALAGVLAALVAALIMPGHASASCAGPPSPSPYRFTGTVTSVERDGVIAKVRTDDGRDVIVRGTPTDNVNARTSVDRHFSAGVRYEFHPVNNSSPYGDSACTATKAIGGTLSPSGGAAVGWAVGGGLLMAALLAAGAWWLLRRRSLRMRQPITPTS